MTSAIILAKENRVMIEDTKDDISCIRKDIRKFDEKLDEAFNHMSKRLPAWATILFTILGSLVTGLIVMRVT